MSSFTALSATKPSPVLINAIRRDEVRERVEHFLDARIPE
jgi:hypothetical protein